MLPPLVERELRVALLRRNARRQWSAAAWTAGGITCLFMLVLGLSSSRSAGRTLYWWLLGLGILGVLKRGFGLTADLFSEERRNGTLGLLVLAGLRPLEIFVSKLLGALVIAACTLLAALPFFAIPFLAGGVHPYQFLCALIFLGNALLFCVSLGLLGSVLQREGSQAQLTSQAVGAILCAATPLIFGIRSLGGAVPGTEAEWLTFSPAYPAYLLFTRWTPASESPFWVGSGMTLCYSLSALLVAAVFLQRTWRDGGHASETSMRHGRWRSWFQGSRGWRRRLRARLLTGKPFCWLAARDRRPVLGGYAIVAVLGVVWLAGLGLVGDAWLIPRNAFISSLVLHQALNVVASYAAARSFADERAGGGFEILLTTPVQPRDIVEGQAQALLFRFRGVALAALLMDAVFCLSAVVRYNWLPNQLLGYVGVWVLVLGLWFGMHFHAASRAMWIAAWTGRAGYAALKATSGQWSLWVWLWILSRGSFTTFINSSPRTMPLSLVLLIPTLLFFSQRREIRQKLARELRLIAAAPIPAPGESRFKKWDPAKIFPPDDAGQLSPNHSPRRRRANEPRRRMDTLNG